MEQSNAVLSALGDAGKRLTVARRAVAEAIAEQAGHFTAEDVLAVSRRRRRAVARATVFRSLDLLVDLGLVERVDLPSGDHAYVACEPDAHHHHVVCSACGRSVEVGELGLRPILERIEFSTGFAIDSHRLELFGLCPECRMAAAAKPSA
ncbi:MAG: transcriptional repressor [Chloroflexi bacterium]|nr:MAG: transcriptional repressor [Chloroflexota bacterium]